MKRLTIQPSTKIGAALAGLLLLAARPASAHFLWAEIREPAKAGETPTLRVALAEAAGEPNSGVPLTRLNAAQVHSEAKPASTLKPADGAMVAPLRIGEEVAGAEQAWGVLDKSEEGRGVFLLNYYAKGATSVAAAAISKGLPLEFYLKRDGANLVATLNYAGKPVPSAAVVLHIPDEEKPRDLTTDAEGQIRFAAEKAGLYGLRGVYTEKKAGVYEEKAYEVVRNYTTLSVKVAAAQPAAAQPAAATTAAVAPAKADPAAYAMLKAASATRQVYPHDFLGLQADFTFSDDGVSHSGTVSYRLDGAKVVRIEGLSTEQDKWIKHQLFSVISHRRNEDFDKGNGRFPVAFGGEATSLGRVIRLNDDNGSLFRVRNNRVYEITRSMENSRFTISIQNLVPTDAGKFVNGDYVVSYRDAKSGALQRVDAFQHLYSNIGRVWIPTFRQVITSAADAPVTRTRTIELKNVEFLKAERVASSQ